MRVIDLTRISCKYNNLLITSMDTQTHNLSSLFLQLGLESDELSIDQFIARNKPVPGNIELHKAEFWNDSQAAFLKEMKQEDADWASVIDQLDVMLRE